MKPRPTRSVNTSLWKLRYRFYAVISVLLLLPIISASSSTTPDAVDSVGYLATERTLLFTKVKKITYDPSSLRSAPIPDLTFAQSAVAGFGLKDEQSNLSREIRMRTASLDELIKRPSAPTRRNFLTYPQYNINVPIVMSRLEDLFETDKDGKLVISPDGSYVERKEDLNRNGPESHPVQLLLKDGIVHIAFTPEPGEIGNSYIVGHSSNFANVKSAYNTIFKPLERISKPGEEFTIWDNYGRELKFKVFETREILEREAGIAYYGSGTGNDIYTAEGRRVVTLQTSILEFVRGQGLQPTKRWLTRGELIL